MRTALGALALAPALASAGLATGCNQIFGLDPVVLDDGAIIVPPDAPLPTVHLVAITPRLDANGAVVGEADLIAIDPPPAVAYGAIGAQVQTAQYAGGEVIMGYDAAELTGTWRLVYKQDGEVPHEVHWSPPDLTKAYATQLQLTAPGRAAIPGPSARFVVKPLVPPTPPETIPALADPRLYTPNAWTATPSLPGNTTNGYTADMGGTVTQPIAGPKRKPDVLLDREVLVEYLADSCRRVTGSTVFQADLINGDSSPATNPVWHTTPSLPRTKILDDQGGSTVNTNLLATYGSSHGRQVLVWGPASKIPLLHQREHAVEGFAAYDMPLPIPVGIPLAICQSSVTPGTELINIRYPSEVALAPIGSVQYATDEIPLAGGGPSVRPGAAMTSTVHVDDVGQNTSQFTLPFKTLDLPTSPTIDGIDASLATTSVVSIPANGATASLDFTLVPRPLDPPAPPYFEATLYRVDGSALVPLREFTFTQKPLVFDRDQGQPSGTKYVFEIRVVLGVGGAAAGDFRTWADVQGLATTYTQVFTLQ